MEESGLDTSGLVDKAHDIVTVGTIVDSADPPRIRRTGKGNRGQKYQRDDDWKRGEESMPHGTE